MTASTSSDGEGAPGTREKIEAVATELLVRRGSRGASLGDIAEALSTTRANIHYHFGNKNALIEDVIEDCVRSTVARFHEIWTNNDSTLAEKIDATLAFNRRRYLCFSSPTANGHASSTAPVRSHRTRQTSNDSSIFIVRYWSRRWSHTAQPPGDRPPSAVLLHAPSPDG